jgi:hypothetical protein
VRDPADAPGDTEDQLAGVGAQAVGVHERGHREAAERRLIRPAARYDGPPAPVSVPA